MDGKEFSSPQGVPEIIGLLSLLKVIKREQIKKNLRYRQNSNKVEDHHSPRHVSNFRVYI